MATKQELLDFAFWMNKRRHKDFRMSQAEIKNELEIYLQNTQAPMFPTEKREDKQRLFKNFFTEFDRDIDLSERKNDFSIHFQTFEFGHVDLQYYYQAIADWNDTKKLKRDHKGWLATARNFMRRDKKDGKLQMLVVAQDQNDIDYLSSKWNR